MSEELVKKFAEALTDDEVKAALARRLSATAGAGGAPAGKRHWDVSNEALHEYDAVDLVALRKDHRAEAHDQATCHTCQVLAKRLGEDR